MDNKGKVRLKSCKKRDLSPLLKPDVMLITKDVMVPVKLPIPMARNCPKTKLRSEKALRFGSRPFKPLLNSRGLRQDYMKQSLSQVKKISSGKKIREETVFKSPFYCLLRTNGSQKDIYVNERADVSLKREDLSSRCNPDLVDLDVRDERIIESVDISRVDKPLTSLSRNSTSSVTTSAETRSFSSSKSLDMIEDSLPKLPLTIISSSESESNICAPGRRAIFVENDKSQTVVQPIIETNGPKSLESEVKCNLNLLNSPNYESSTENINEESKIPTKENSCTREGSDVDVLITDHKNDRDTKEIAKTIVELNVFEENLIMIDVEYLLQSLLTNLETVEDFNSLDNCDGNIVAENESLQDDTVLNVREEVLNKSDHNLKERIPKMVEFRYSLHDLLNTVPALNSYDHSCSEQVDIDSERRYFSEEFNLTSSVVTGIKIEEEECKTVYDNPDIKSNQSNEEIEVKYSWQIIAQNNQAQDKNSNEENSKLTSTEDLCLNEPEFRYSWEKLTSKYLAGKHAGDSLNDMNQPAPNINDIPKYNSNAECIKPYSPLRETHMHDLNMNGNPNKEKKSKAAEDIGRLLTNSPLNNIISSMLPEIKLFNRRISFKDTTSEIIGNRRDNYLSSYARSDSNKSSTSYSSVSTIKHVIENLNEMVTSQKHMLEAYLKSHELDKNLNVTEPSVIPIDTAEKVEIFPSTLHVLGNYIVRDIRPADMNDQRNLLDPNKDETIQQDNLLSDYSVTVQNPALDKLLENVLTAKIPTRLNNSWSHLPIDVKLKDAESSSLLNDPMSPGNDYYPTIFATDHSLASEIKNSPEDEPRSSTSGEDRNSLVLPVLGYDRQLTENIWEPAIAEMEEMTGLSPDAARCMNDGKDDGNKAVPHTKNTGPLAPRVQVSFSETREAVGDSKTRKDELLARLESAMNRLKQSEQHVDANWNLDYSVLDIEDSVAGQEAQLPKEVEDHIKDIVKSAEEYLAKLEEQLNDLRNADDQIINSSERTFKDIDESYQIFMDNLCQEINKRRNLVRLETEVFKYEGLAPLRACKQEVDAQIRSTQHLIVLTENMLTHPITFNKERLGKIITATSHMGRIPAVPMPEELPYVSFGPLNEEIKKEIVDRISCLGCVLRMGPAQFTEVWERPACLQLKWHVTDPEYASEEQTFIVQKALGEIIEPTSTAFETVYVGQEATCFVREIPVDQPVTLRVGIQVTDTAWSVYRIAQTSIPAYGWDTSNSDYLITNSGRIATKVTQNLSTLLSLSAQFSTNYIIEFKFLEAASGSDEEGIGLVFEPGGADETLKRNGAILITPNGNIFMNGEQKLMQLPKMELGTRIVFTSEQKDNETLRMTIECANKAVTYDWTVQRPLHFAARFLEHNKWNLLVK